MKFKEGVYTQVTRIINSVEVVVKPSIHNRLAWTIADEVSKRITGKEIVITSILDGNHKDGSKHYTGDAFDQRKHIYTPQQQKELLKELRAELGPDYDVVEEATHFHIEYDPK